MNKIVSLALLVGGVVLIIVGINATNSFSSDVSRFFTGSPTDKAVWMLIGGIVASVIGLVGTARNWKRISSARLRAVPWARFSKEVEATMERQGVVSRAHFAEVASVRGPAARSFQKAQTSERSEEPAPNDEALLHVYSTPDQHPQPRKRSGRKHEFLRTQDV